MKWFHIWQYRRKRKSGKLRATLYDQDGNDVPYERFETFDSSGFGGNIPQARFINILRGSIICSAQVDGGEPIVFRPMFMRNESCLYLNDWEKWRATS